MFPGSMITHRIDCTMWNAKFFSQFFGTNPRFYCFTNISNFFCRPFRCAYFFSPCLPVLFYFIRDIVGLAANKQVLLPYAWWIIASVQNINISRQLRVALFVDIPMASFGFPFTIDKYGNFSISALISITCPDPAAIFPRQFLHLRPKAFIGVGQLCALAAYIRAKSSSSLLFHRTHLVARMRKDIATIFASFFYQCCALTNMTAGIRTIYASSIVNPMLGSLKRSVANFAVDSHVFSSRKRS